MLRDTWLIFRRDYTLLLRNPAWLAIGAMQPVLYLVLFGPLMERIVTSTPGFPPGDSWTILTPALIIQLSLFSATMAGFSLLADLRNGVVERLRVTPASRVALLLGKVLTNGLTTIVQALIITTLAFLVFDLSAPVGGIVLTLLIVGMLSVTLASASYAVALTLRNEEAFPAVVNSVLMPVLLLSGILVPITTGLAPQWLYSISRVNPFTHIVDAGRASFRGDFSVDALLTGSVVLLVLMSLAVFWGARTFRRENA
ncbi:multidrug ABC transporter permease [Saccharomonospora sp. CUA-673]|uniref:ABC transporter permease n=1 Tax=Saccharomonospora sp. CUA-673 TaxID=1904969 RepID=UPI000964653B|nr:ABC transporter permease [Saccharomonospora sp. CUA-673]OLT49249.1 multidrug ABC transporter permease [Saccharomonospora sp. CUA-673]